MRTARRITTVTAAATMIGAATVIGAFAAQAAAIGIDLAGPVIETRPV